MTDAENKLWQALRRKSLGYKFNRQYVFDDKYIVDFYCAEKSLIIELDGGQHNENPADQIRDNYLKSRGCTVLRFWNNELLANFDNCLLIIKNKLDEL